MEKGLMLNILKRTKNKIGMTLFEMLIAMAITALMFTASIGAVAMAQRSYRGLVAQVEACTFMTENINAVRHVIREMDVNYPVTLEGGLLPSGDSDTIFEIPGQKITLTSVSAGYRGYFDNVDGLIKFMWENDGGYSGEPIGTIMSVNSNKRIPFKAKIVFTDETDIDKMKFVFVVSIYNGDELVTYAKASAMPIEAENINY